ncbi:MAG: family 78 glycoside hydrolase catalytic domain [Vicinamibacterales bacterium]
MRSLLVGAAVFLAVETPHGAVQPAARTQASAPALRLEGLRTEYKENPLGIDSRAPRLSWKIVAPVGDRNVRQTAYQIRVARASSKRPRDDAAATAGSLLWDSGRVASAESIHRAYEGTPLASGQRYMWQVQVWDDRGRSSGWSGPAWWEMGLLSPADWRASWIEPGLQEDVTTSPPVPLLRRVFRLTQAVQSARAYVTSHGVYELHLNGRRVGDEVLTPGWTSYATRLQYQIYDVTGLLRRGDNAAGVLLGNGWYRGNIGFSKRRNVYGDRLALLLQIDVTYADGSRETIGSDGKWKASSGPIVMSEIYHGETYDARLERSGWTDAAFDDRDWSPARTVQHSKDVLIAPAGPPIKRTDELRPRAILRTPAGQQVVDMGQNMVGWVRLRVRGPSGTVVTLRHAEVLDKDGNFYTRNLRAAAQTIKYTLNGGGVETYEPRFTFQGFRYVAVDGYPGELTPDSLTGIVVHSAITRSGEFSASHAILNQLQHNIVWGQKGNFLDVPTDCPQRDERLGWTGDAQAFARTAAFNMDVAGFFTKWLKDLEADQYKNGAVPHVIPDVLTLPAEAASAAKAGWMQAGAAGWADAAVIIPWTVYLTYGDTRVLQEQYASMTRWVDYMRLRAGEDDIWSGDFHFGDWLSFATTRPDYPGATTGKDLIATAFFAHSTDLLGRIARVLGKGDDAARYREQFERIKEAFVREFVTPAARVGEGTQTAYVLALQFDLLPEAIRATAAGHLVRDVRERKHLTTGFLGTPYLLHVLARYGYLDEAYLLLEREQYPSWLYPITKGATTIWERWDGIKPDGSFQDQGMNSFNHYAYGAVGDWMYRVMAGIEIDDAAPGYRHVLIQPRPGGKSTKVSASHDTPYGRVASSWTLAGERFERTVQVPPNTRAAVRLPRARLAAVTEGGQPLERATEVYAARQENDDVVLEVGSGQYRFSSIWKDRRSVADRLVHAAHEVADRPDQERQRQR